jgi:hypothetical protein
MRPKALLVAAATALALAACHAADATGPAARTPAAPRAEGGTGMFGSGGYVPTDTTPPKP